MPLPAEHYGKDDADLLKTAFEREYAALFGRIIPKLEVEAITWTLALATEQDAVEALADVGDAAAPDPIGNRQVFDPATGTAHEALIYARTSMNIGAGLQGPALIVEDETTTVVPPGFAARVNGGGHIVLTRKEG